MGFITGEKRNGEKPKLKHYVTEFVPYYIENDFQNLFLINLHVLLHLTYMSHEPYQIVKVFLHNE